VPNAGGTYEFRYLLNDGFTDVARSAAITVTGGTAPTPTATPTGPTPTAVVGGSGVRDYYVSSGEVCANSGCYLFAPSPVVAGDDAKDGRSMASAKRTLVAALQQIKADYANSKDSYGAYSAPGVTLHLLPGVYDAANGLRHLIPSGDDTADFVFKAENPTGLSSIQYQDTLVKVIRKVSDDANLVARAQSKTCTDAAGAPADCIGAPTYADCLAYPWFGPGKQWSRYPGDCWSGGGDGWMLTNRMGGSFGAILDAGFDNDSDHIWHVTFDGIDFDARGAETNVLSTSVTWSHRGSSAYLTFTNGTFQRSGGSCTAQPTGGARDQGAAEGNPYGDIYKGIDWENSAVWDPNQNKYVQGPSIFNNFVFKNIKFHDCGIPFNTLVVDGHNARMYPGVAKFLHAMYMHLPGDTCDGCESWSNSGQGFAGKGDVIKNSYAHDNATYALQDVGEFFNNIFYNNGDAEVQVGAGKFYNNTLVRGPMNETVGYQLNWWEGATIFENNIFYGYPTGILSYQTASGQNIIRNNIFYPAPGGVAIKYIGTQTSTELNNVIAGVASDSQPAIGAYQYAGVPITACSPANQTVAKGSAASFTASGGSKYTWNAGNTGNPSQQTGSGSSFSTTFASEGVYTVAVNGGTATGICTVSVTR